MGPMQNSRRPLRKDHRDARTGTFFDFRSKRNKQGLDSGPADVGAGWTSKNGFERPAMFLPHQCMVPHFGASCQFKRVLPFLVAALAE